MSNINRDAVDFCRRMWVTACELEGARQRMHAPHVRSALLAEESRIRDLIDREYALGYGAGAASAALLGTRDGKRSALWLAGYADGLLHGLGLS